MGAGPGSGLLLGAHYPATSFLRGFSTGEWRSQRLLPLLRLEEGCSKTTFRGIYPARSRTLEDPSIPEVISGLGASSRAPGA